MNYKIQFLTLLFCIICIQAFSQKKRISKKKMYTTGEVVLKSGEKITGKIGFPLFNAADVHMLNLKRSKNQKYVFIKDTEGEIKKILQNEIAILKASNASGEIELRRAETFRYNNDGEWKSYGFHYWLAFREGCEEIKGYVVVNSYDLTKKGEFIALYEDKVAQYALWRKGEESPTIIGNVVMEKENATKSYNKERRKKLELYFNGSEKGLKFLKDKKRVTPIELSEYITEQCQN